MSSGGGGGSSKQVSHPKHARSKVLAPREDRMPKNDRGWGGAGAVGWGVLGAFGSMEKDTGAQVVRNSNTNFKMVKDEKGLWVKVKVDAPVGGGRGRGGGIPAMGAEGEVVFGRLQEQEDEEGYGGRDDDRGRGRGRGYDSEEEEEDYRDRRKGRRHSRSRSRSRGRDRDRRRRSRSRSGSRGRKRGYSPSRSPRDRKSSRRSRSSSRDRDRRRRRSRSDSRGRDRRRSRSGSRGRDRRRDDRDEKERRGRGGREECEERQERAQAAAPPAAREEEEAAPAPPPPPPNPEEMSFTAAQLADRLVEVYNTSSPRRYDNIAACFQPDVALCVLKSGAAVIKGVERLRDSMPSDFSKREATCTRRLLILPDDPADPSFALDFYPAGHAPGMQAFGKGDTPLDTVLLFQAAPGPKNRIAQVWIAPDAKGLATAEKVSELDVLSSKLFAQVAAVVKERVKGGGTSQHFHDYKNMETIG